MLKKKTYNLCRPCAEEMQTQGVTLRLVKTRKDNKITCDKCGRRRFGATWESVKKN